MADNFKALIEALKADNQDTREELRDTSNEQVESINTLHKSLVSLSEKQLESLEKSFGLMQEDMRDRAREEKLKGSVNPADVAPAGADVGQGSAAFQAGENFVGMFFAPFGNLLASLTAFGGALAGLRGWEAGALKNVDKIGANLKALMPESLAKTIDQKFINARARILTTFGLDASLGKKDPETGKRGLKTPVLEQINARFAQVKANVLKMFGLGVDGKPIAIRGEGGKFMTNTKGKFWADIVERIGSVLNPLKNAGQAVADFSAGAGAKLFTFLKDVGSKATGFLGIVGKILKPIGFLFSAFDGVTAYMESDKDGFIARLGDGVGAFLGDFIGAPFDLLKSGVSWILKKFFGVEVDKEGNAKPGQGLAGWAVTKLNSFSFEETIGGIISGMFGIVQGAVDWVGTLFTDPKKALTDLFTTIYGEGGIANMIFNGISGGIDWIAKKFGWKDEDAPPFDLYATVRTSLAGIGSWLGIKLEEAVTAIKAVPGEIMLAAETFWTNLKADFAIGMIEVTDFFTSLPAKLLSAIANIIGAVKLDVPNWVPGIGGKSFSLLDEETIASANAAVRNAQNNQAAEIAAINDRRQAQLLAIEERAKQVQAQQPIVVNNVDNSNRSVNTTVGGDSNTAVGIGGASNSLSNGMPAGAMPF